METNSLIEQMSWAEFKYNIFFYFSCGHIQIVDLLADK